MTKINSLPFLQVVTDITSKYNKIRNEDYLEEGLYPIIDQGQVFIGGYSNNTSLINHSSSPVIVFGDHTKALKYIDFPFAIGADGVKVLKIDEKSAVSRYIYYFLKTLKLPEAGYSRHFKYLKDVKLPILESLSDQLHIANILSQTENLIAQRKESIRLLDEFLKSAFLEIFGNPLTNEKGWPLLEVSKIGESRLGKMLDGKKIIGNNLKPYLRNSNVLWFKFKLDELLEMDFDEKDRMEFALKYGDILMCEGGEIGRCAIWKEELEECYIQKAIHRIRLKSEYALPEYFVFMFWIYTSLGGLKKFTGAATISHLTGEKLKKMKLPMPPIARQTQFTQIVEKTEAVKTQYQQSLQELENLYASLSQRAFKGELTTKDGEMLIAAEPEVKYMK